MGVKKNDKKGKKKPKNNPTSKKYTKYKINGDKIQREASCPRCGPGIFLMQNSGRLYCGKCHYTEFEGKPKEPVPEKAENNSKEEKKK